MADDVTFQPTVATPPTGTKVATDDVGGSHFQRVKLDLGADGASAPVEGTMPVTVTEPVTVDGTVAVSGTVTVDATATTQPVSHAALTELAAAIDTEVQVDVVGPLPAGDNNIGDVDIVSMPNVTLNEPVSVDDNGGSLTIDGAVSVSNFPATQPVSGTVTVNALPAGTANIGDVDVLSIAAGDNNIGNVDVVTLPGVGGDIAHDLADSGNPVKVGGKASTSTPASVANGDRVDAWFVPSGAQTVTLVDAAGTAIDTVGAGPTGLRVGIQTPISGGTEASAVRVTIASDSTGVIGVTGIDSRGAAITGKPFVIAGRASATAPGATGQDAVVDAWLTLNGAQATFLTAAGALIGGDATNGLDVDVTRLPALVAGTANIGDVDVASMPTAATATLSNVASSATSVTLLALNTSRKGASIHNDSTQILYVKFGTTASATSYTVKMLGDAHYEVPFGYTGRIDGIWVSADGNARVTELT